MALQLGDLVPNFIQESTEGKLDFHKFIADDWCVLFSHPKDFTPVCTTELGEAAKLKEKFSKRNCKIIGLSVDSLESHNKWIPDIKETQGVALNFPLIADFDRSVSDLYGMIHPQADNTLTVRTVFVIDSNKKLRMTLTYPASTGRNFDEILRVIDSLQMTDRNKVATPVNWKNGEEVIVVPSVSTEEAKELFSGDVREIKPYLRYTSCPK